MQFVTRYFNFLAAVVVLSLSAAALFFNCYVTQFPGNNYTPPGFYGIAAILFFSLVGTYLSLGKDNDCWRIMLELVYFFLVISVIACATNAVQFTPFSPIDNKLIAADKLLGIHLEKIVGGIISTPWLRKILVFCYDTLPFQMCYVPLILIFSRKFPYLREYYSYLLLTSLFGFAIYYFWPTIGPASAIVNPVFNELQYATGVKFDQIHEHIPPTTYEGGMVAMPSFHVIWATLSLNLSRCLPCLFVILLPINSLLIASCVLLGWHYLVDLIGSFAVLLISYLSYAIFRTKPVG